MLGAVGELGASGPQAGEVDAGALGHDEVAPESAAGWRTSRVQRAVLILGSLDGVLTGIRRLRRTESLETEVIAGLRVPTLAEMARIDAWLLATRHTVRDYLDTVVLLETLGDERIRGAPGLGQRQSQVRTHDCWTNKGVRLTSPRCGSPALLWRSGIVNEAWGEN